MSGGSLELYIKKLEILIYLKVSIIQSKRGDPINDKKERRGRNPATGDSMMLRPRRVVKFKVSGKLRKKVNG